MEIPENAAFNKQHEHIVAPSLDEILTGPRIILGPFPSDYYDNREVIQTLVCRPEGYTGMAYKVNIVAVRAGDAEKIAEAKQVLELYEAGRHRNAPIKYMGREELIVILKQMQELVTSISEGEKVMKSL